MGQSDQLAEIVRRHEMSRGVMGKVDHHQSGLGPKQPFQIRQIQKPIPLRIGPPEIDVAADGLGDRRKGLIAGIMNHNVIAGIKRDPTFGPVVLAGAGGVLTELLRDSSLRIATFDRMDARDMIEELKVGKLLAGYRGAPALDRDALEDLLVRLSRLAVNYPAIRELDFNPVFIGEESLVIGDVRIITREHPPDGTV